MAKVDSPISTSGLVLHMSKAPFRHLACATRSCYTGLLGDKPWKSSRNYAVRHPTRSLPTRRPCPVWMVSTSGCTFFIVFLKILAGPSPFNRDEVQLKTSPAGFFQKVLRVALRCSGRSKLIQDSTLNPLHRTPSGIT